MPAIPVASPRKGLLFASQGYKALAKRGYRASSSLLVALAFPFALILLWEAASRFGWMSEQILPPPLFTLETAQDLLQSGQLGHELGVSFLRLVVGFTLGASLGLLSGLLFAFSKTADDYIAPTVRAICLVPSLGWLPFFMMIFGIGETLKFILIAKTCFLPLMINSYNASKNLSAKYQDIARSLELTSWDRVRYIYLPAIAPAVFTGLRLSLSKGWKALILVEMIASSAGIGYLMTWGRKAFQLDVVIVTMIVIGLAGWIIDYLAARLEKRWIHWAHEVTS